MNAKPWNTPAVCPTPHSEILSSQIEFWVKKTCLTWFHQDHLSEMVLILWGKGECVFSQWHTLPISVLLFPGRLGSSEFQCRLKERAVSKVLWLQDTAPHVADPRKRISAYLKQDLMFRVWLISANFMSWFGALSLLYHHLIRKTVVGYAVTSDADKILPWR